MISALLPLLGASVARADCPTPRTTADLVSALDEARGAYGNLEVDAFRASIDKARAVLPCVTDEVTSHLAAEMHRYEGLLAFVDRQPERSTVAFAAARGIEPNYRFPESLVPAGNPVLDDYGAIDPDAGKTETLPEPLAGRIAFDGKTSTQRPLSFPTVVQLVDENGAVTSTAYLWPGDPSPKYAPKPPPDVVAGGGTTGSSGPNRSAFDGGPNKGVLVAAGVAGAVAGALYGGAFVVHGRYENEATPIPKLDGLRTVNNSLVIASGASVAVAVSLGTAAFVVARF